VIAGCDDFATTLRWGWVIIGSSVAGVMALLALAGRLFPWPQRAARSIGSQCLVCAPGLR